jgi:hypothetical protein
MTPHEACAHIAGIINRNCTKQDTMHEALCRNDVQALCFAIGYMYHLEETEAPPQSAEHTTEHATERAQRHHGK